MNQDTEEKGYNAEQGLSEARKPVEWVKHNKDLCKSLWGPAANNFLTRQCVAKCAFGPDDTALTTLHDLKSLAIGCCLYGIMSRNEMEELPTEGRTVAPANS